MRYQRRVHVWFIMFIALLFVVAGTFSTRGVKAQQEKTLALGQPVTGTITSTKFQDIYTFKANKGDSVVFTMVGDGGLDAFVSLKDDAGNTLAEDDDSGGAPDAKLTYTFDKSDNYKVIATRAGQDTGTTTGTYTLKAEAAGQASGTAAATTAATTGATLAATEEATLAETLPATTAATSVATRRATGTAVAAAPTDTAEATEEATAEATEEVIEEPTATPTRRATATRTRTPRPTATVAEEPTEEAPTEEAPTEVAEEPTETPTRRPVATRTRTPRPTATVAEEPTEEAPADVTEEAPATPTRRATATRRPPTRVPPTAAPASNVRDGGPIASGDTVDGEIDDTTVFVIYSYQGTAGEQVTLRLTSSGGLIPVLRLFFVKDRNTLQDVKTTVASRANAPINMSAQLPEDGSYVIVVSRQRFEQGTSSGAFTLSFAVSSSGGNGGGGETVDQIDPAGQPAAVVARLAEQGIVPKTGRLLFNLPQNSYIRASTPGIKFLPVGRSIVATDFMINFRVRWPSAGATSGCGMGFREVNNQKYGVVLLTNDGKAAIIQFDGSNTPTNYFEDSELVLTKDINVVTLIGIGNKLTLYVNGKLQASITGQSVRGAFDLAMVNARDNQTVTNCIYPSGWIWSFDK